MASDRSSGSKQAGAPPASTRAAPIKKVTLQFAGPKLALPGEPEADAGLAAGEEQTGGGVREADPSTADAWTRLRESELPGRSKSLTPAPFARDDALDLVSKRSRPPSTPGLDLRSEMLDRHALGDYTGALRVAELLLGKYPEDLDAQRVAEGSRDRLIQLYSARLVAISAGRGDSLAGRVPRVIVPDHEIRWLGLDHRQGFLLSRLDGTATVDDLVDMAGMTRLEVLRTLVELVEARAITIG